MNINEEYENMINPADFGNTGVSLSNPITNNIIKRVNINDIVDTTQIRTRENPEKENIKNSIRLITNRNNNHKLGLLQMLKVALNPKTQKYELYDGGGTRLEVIKELARETGLEVYQNIEVVLTPWENENERDEIVDIIHRLTENNLRGGMLLIERAQKISQIEYLFKQKQVKISSDNNYGLTTKLLEFLEEKGYGVSRTNLSIYRFTTNHLSGVFNWNLYQGMGKDQIIKIRKIYNNFTKIITEIAPNLDEHTRDNLFDCALKEYDRKEIPFEYFMFANIVIKYLVGESPIQNSIYGTIETLEEALLRDKKDADSQETNFNDEELNEVVESVEQNPQTEQYHDGGYPSDKDINLTESANTVSKDHEDNIPEEHTTEEIENNNQNITELRTQAYQLAQNLVRNLAEGIVLEQINTGAGYLVKKTPEKQKSGEWFMMHILLDLSLAANYQDPIDNHNINVKKLSENKNLINVYLSNNVEELENSILDLVDKSGVITPLPNIIGQYKRSLSRTDMQKLSNLEFLVYQIANICKDGEKSVWDSTENK